MTPLRILWLSHFVPYPPKGGAFQRSYNLIARVGAIHEVHLIAMRHKEGTHPLAEVADAAEALSKHCRKVEIVDMSANTRGAGLALRAARALSTGASLTAVLYRSPRVAEMVASAVSPAPDVVHFDSISLAEYAPHAAGIPSVLTHHGAESHMIRRRLARERNVGKKVFFLAEWRQLERLERRWCPRFGTNVVMSGRDLEILRTIAPSASFDVVPNGVDVEYYLPENFRANRRSLVFAGRLDQYSNRDAILFFVSEAWPLVRDRWPDATLSIIGNHPPRGLVEMAARRGGVRVLGFVPDVRPHFAQAAVAICPIRDGGGTRVKILDNLAMGKPMVATSIACEGIDVVPERHLLIANTPIEFAAQIDRLFTDEALCGRLGTNARKLACEKYSWNNIVRDLCAVYDRVRRPGAFTAAAAKSYDVQ